MVTVEVERRFHPAIYAPAFHLQVRDHEVDTLAGFPIVGIPCVPPGGDLLIEPAIWDR